MTRKNIPTFTIKSPNRAEDMTFLTPKMLLVWSHFTLFAHSRDLPIKVTNILQKFSVSKSNTHPEGRAIDVSVKNWKPEDISNCLDYLNEKVGKYGAISKASGMKRVVYFHDAGLGPHFHLQVSR